MAKYIGPKHKLARREGMNIFGKTSQSLTRRLNVIPGSHSKRRRKLSDFGIQLREKQKLKKIYGILEKQSKKYVVAASKAKENTEDVLVQLLERRLDNVVYRLGFAKSRFQSRQLVSHGHVLVNGKKINIPSYPVNEGDILTLSNKFFKTEDERKILEETVTLPFVDRKDLTGKLLRMPNREDVQNPVDYQLVIEFYSR